jgi:hypothetical protein
MDLKDEKLFFLSPRVQMDAPNDFGVLYLLRRDIDRCMGIDPNTGTREGSTALWPGAMAILAGVDLLAKFVDGSDGGDVGDRFRRFLERFQMTKPADSQVIYQLRNSLLHSFGLYSKTRPTKTKKSEVYRFILTDSGTGPLVSPKPSDRYYVDLRALHRSFEAAVDAYRAALSSDLSLQANFDAMFGNYGCIPISDGRKTD